MSVCESYENKNVRLEVNHLSCIGGRQIYRYVVQTRETPLHGFRNVLKGDGLASGVGDEVDAKRMLGSLVNFLQPGIGCYDSSTEEEFANTYGEGLWLEVILEGYCGRHKGYNGFEVFRLEEDDDTAEGFYFAFGAPGCLFDSEPEGPYDTSFDAYCAAMNLIEESEV